MALTRRRVAAVAVLAAVVVAALAARRLAAGGDAARADGACRPAVDRGVLPTWARTGFSAAEPRLPHVVGRRGTIAALLFGDPLSAPPAPARSNKILWVARRPLNGPADLTVRAQRMEGRRRVGAPVRRRVAGGPGPSIIDVPRPGCWRMRLRWAGRTDELDLEYASRAPGSIRRDP
jgi:hypothetical protein